MIVDSGREKREHGQRTHSRIGFCQHSIATTDAAINQEYY